MSCRQSMDLSLKAGAKAGTYTLPYNKNIST